MSCVASFLSGFEACFVCDIVCKWSRCSSWPRSTVASNKVSFVVSSARGRTLPSGAALGYLGSVLGASGTSWGGFWDASGTSWGGFWELRGRLGRLLGAPGASGDASGCFGGVSGRLLGASRASRRGSWELPRRPGERPGVLLGRLGKRFGAPREPWERKDAKVRITVLPKEFIGF